MRTANMKNWLLRGSAAVAVCLALGAPAVAEPRCGVGSAQSTAPGGGATSSPSCGETVSGYDSGPVTATGVVNASSHAAGQSIGGLMTVNIARYYGGEGIITTFSLMSPGGSTGQYVVRLWAKNPVNTTCADNTAFSGSATDDAFLIVPPFSVTPSAPAVTTGDAKTYASLQGLTWDFRNQDANPGIGLYVCVVTVSTDTADESTSITVMMSGPRG
jgi:hypothetical protein